MLPEYITATLKLVEDAFPKGIDEDEFYALLKILGEHLSQRNLALAMSAVADKDYAFVYNEVLGIAGKVVPEETMRVVQQKLDANGFQNWLSVIE